MDNNEYLYSDYEKEKSLKDCVVEWVNGDDLQSIRNNYGYLFYNEILNSKSYPVLYRYIDKRDKHSSLENYEKGDIVILDLVSTTTNTPKEAWDEWFDEQTNVILIRNAKGLDVSEFGADKFSWEKEIITCGAFKYLNREEKSFRGNPYILYTIEYINDKGLQFNAMNPNR